MAAADAGLTQFNALSEDALRACCAAPEWISAMSQGRPYDDRASVHATSAAALAALDWPGVRAALDAHPRIGERAAGTGTEAAWSRAEQSGMDSASAQTKAALVEANRAYEDRFGHVFLIFATGKADAEMLAAAQARVDHDDATEQAVVRAELAKIVDLRLTRLLDGTAG
jgi:2-oxo-4-hydroxy-4-carboxy-5-ureidoimidazoline decarboxylase